LSGRCVPVARWAEVYQTGARVLPYITTHKERDPAEWLCYLKLKLPAGKD
jgi:hypothetical protein